MANHQLAGIHRWQVARSLRGTHPAQGVDVMGSYYLTDEAEAKRKEALIKRIMAEADTMDDGSKVFPPESSFWLLPDSMQQEVLKSL